MTLVVVILQRPLLVELKRLKAMLLLNHWLLESREFRKRIFGHVEDLKPTPIE